MPMFLSTPPPGRPPDRALSESTTMMTKYHHLRRLLSLRFVDGVANGREMPEGELVSALEDHVERCKGQWRNLCATQAQFNKTRMRLAIARKEIYTRKGPTADLMNKLGNEILPGLLHKIGQYQRDACKED